MPFLITLPNATYGALVTLRSPTAGAELGLYCKNAASASIPTQTDYEYAAGLAPLALPPPHAAPALARDVSSRRRLRAHKRPLGRVPAASFTELEQRSRSSSCELPAERVNGSYVALFISPYSDDYLGDRPGFVCSVVNVGSVTAQARLVLKYREPSNSPKAAGIAGIWFDRSAAAGTPNARAGSALTAQDRAASWLAVRMTRQGHAFLGTLGLVVGRRRRLGPTAGAVTHLTAAPSGKLLRAGRCRTAAQPSWAACL